jgi:CPA2 family monovalent cation:H+ antiporter-2
MELPALIKDLALILFVAGVTTLIFKKLKQPLVLGYIVAGFLVSPHMPYTMSVIDKENIQTWADIGVLFLLFSLGLDFSFKKILKMGMSPIIAAISIIFCMMTLGFLVGHTFGWSHNDCIFLGGMLAMSSTTIIYKAFDDMGLRQQGFASLVMSVLVLEDVLAIVLMVMLSAIAGGNPDGGVMLSSVFKIVFFLILWFVVGIFVIPLFLKETRQLMTDETLVIVALGLCCLMAVISSSVGFSSAFGAFVMGSILAETVEADRIIKLVEPVKNLFGAIFFVSVGMLVDPKVLVEYAWPIVALTLTIIFGQCIFGTAGFMLSGQPLKTAMRCGFSMAQIGEFAFIIASLGLSMKVIGSFLYPVVVAVSVITTFLTPYIIRAAEPSYHWMECHLPKKWIRRLNHLGTGRQDNVKAQSDWNALLRKLLLSTLIYSILCLAILVLMLTFFLPFVRHLLPHWWANGVCGVVTVALMSPFLRSLVMKHNHSEEFRSLWTSSRLNRLPLIFTILVRLVIAAGFLFYLCNYLARFTNALVITLAVVVITLMVLSRRLKHRSIRLERQFIQNLNSREIDAQAHGNRRPAFESNLLDRDIHISDFDLPEESSWAGKTLRQLKFRTLFGVHVSSIQRGRQRINIPNGDTIIFPGDRLQVIGSDEQLQKFGQAMKTQVLPDPPVDGIHEMRLRKVILGNKCEFIGKKLSQSGIREKYNCMVVGVDEGQQNLTMISPDRELQAGDLVWIVGEEQSLKKLILAMR